MAVPQTAEFQVREVCETCSGTGRIDIEQAYCATCGATWPAASLAAHLDQTFGGWWGYRFVLVGDLLWQLFCRLPCKHQLKQLRYTDPTCHACRGRGARFRWVTMREIKNGLLATLTQSGQKPAPPAKTLSRSGYPGYRGRMPGFPTVPPVQHPNKIDTNNNSNQNPNEYDERATNPTSF